MGIGEVRLRIRQDCTITLLIGEVDLDEGVRSCWPRHVHRFSCASCFLDFDITGLDKSVEVNVLLVVFV